MNDVGALSHFQRINELQEQVSDLMLHFEAQAKLQAQLDSSQVSKEEIESSQVGVSANTPEKRQRLPDSVTYYYGNPFVEKTEGILHFFKYNDERLGREVHCRMLCMLAVPSQITLREILLFIGPNMQTIERLKIIRDSTPNEYMIILKFKTHNDAVVFYDEFNGTQFNSLEPNRCRLLFVDKIECASEDEVATLCSSSATSSDGASSSACLTELPTCAVCLERMDDSVVSILCNHTFHAGCIEQWTDTTCPVCRYIQTPELVAEQRCSICGQSSDLWICLICGNIGCGRYAEGHAYRHFENTSHTFCLQVGGQRVWDYAGDNYVHRLIQSDVEGKVVEYQRGDREAESDEKKEKLDGIKLEYTCLLTSQLESQRMYFEARLADMERAMNNMEKMAQAQIDDLEAKLSQSTNECKELRKEVQEAAATKQANEKKHSQTVNKLAKVTSELKAEQEINEMLRADQQVWKSKVVELENKCATSELQFSKGRLFVLTFKLRVWARTHAGLEKSLLPLFMTYLRGIYSRMQIE
nr:BRCA1-associated 2 and Zinc finger domain containing protein [Haemonchus contortus]